MANVLDLRRRIRSVKNTRQITKAMKMVSAAKLRRAQERALAVGEANELLTNRLRRSPNVSEIAAYLELSEEEVLDGLMASQAYATTSLDAPPSSAEDSDVPSFESELGREDERYELIDDKLAVAGAVCSLPKSQRRILHLRFIEELTQREIGAQLGVSQMQVSRLLQRSLAQLRTHAAADG